MKYNISELQQANIDFREVFGTGLGPYLESQITAMTGQLVLNIIDFHKYLEKKHSENHQSFNKLLSDNYGEKGIQLIKKLTL